MRLFGGKSCKQQDEHATNEASPLQRQGPLSLSTCLGMEKLRTRISSVSSPSARVVFAAASRQGKSGGRAKGAIMIHSAEPQ